MILLHKKDLTLTGYHNPSQVPRLRVRARVIKRIERQGIEAGIEELVRIRDDEDEIAVQKRDRPCTPRRKDRISNLRERSG